MSSQTSSRERNAPLGGPASVVDTTCPLDCPDACSLAVTVQHGRVIKIDASPRNPVTGGLICTKVQKFGGRVYGPDRLLYPSIRKGRKGEGKFARATWDEALERIVQEIERAKARSGPASILPFSNGASNGLLTQDNFDARLWRGLGTSRLERDVCAAPTGTVNTAVYGQMPSVAYQDFPDAALIVLWGVNPSASSIHLLPYVMEARKRGASLIVVDPRTTPLAHAADIHLQVKPGTDVVVALALHRYLFTTKRADETFLRQQTHGAEQLRERAEPWTFEAAAAVAGVEASLLERAADLYARSTPALIRCGWGLERNRNGGSAAMAVLALPAVGGKFGVRGGGYALGNPGVAGIRRPWIGAGEPDARRINVNHLGRALTRLTDPAIDVLFVYNANPAVTAPDQARVLSGLGRDDLFTVVVDQVMTDTALYADVLLPATTFLEGYDITRAGGPASLSLVSPAIDAVGDARANADIFGELCVRLGVQDAEEAATELDLLVQVLDGLPAAEADAVRESASSTPAPAFAPVQFVDVFPNTPGRKVDLFPAELERAAPLGIYRFQPDAASERHPLALISPASERTMTSTLGELPRPDAKLTMNPEDAAARGLAEGDLVRMFNDLGEVHCTLAVSASVRPGTASLPKGLWRRGTRNGFTGTALAPDSLTDVGGGACINDARVQVASLPVA